MKINAEEGKGWKEEKGVNRVCVAMAGPSLGATTGTTRGHWDNAFSERNVRVNPWTESIVVGREKNASSAAR